MPMRWQAGTGPSQLHLMASLNSQLHLMANSLPLCRFCFCSKLSAALAGGELLPVCCSTSKTPKDCCCCFQVTSTAQLLWWQLPSRAEQSPGQTPRTPGGRPASRRLLPAFQACRRLSHLCPAGPPVSSYPLLQLLHVSSCLMLDDAHFWHVVVEKASLSFHIFNISSINPIFIVRPFASFVTRVLASDDSIQSWVLQVIDDALSFLRVLCLEIDLCFEIHLIL